MRAMFVRGLFISMFMTIIYLIIADMELLLKGALFWFLQTLGIKDKETDQALTL